MEPFKAPASDFNHNATGPVQHYPCHANVVSRTWYRFNDQPRERGERSGKKAGLKEQSHIRTRFRTGNAI